MKHIICLLLVIFAGTMPLAAQTDESAAPLVMLDAAHHDLTSLTWHGREGFSGDGFDGLVPGGHRTIELPRFPLLVNDIFRPGHGGGQEYTLFTRFGVDKTFLETGSGFVLNIPAIGQGWQIYLNGTLLAGSPRPEIPGGVFTGLRVPVAAGLLAGENVLAVRIVAAPGSLPIVDNVQAGLLFRTGMLFEPAAFAARHNAFSLLGPDSACWFYACCGVARGPATGRAGGRFHSAGCVDGHVAFLLRPPLFFQPGSLSLRGCPWFWYPPPWLRWPVMSFMRNRYSRAQLCCCRFRSGGSAGAADCAAGVVAVGAQT
jgi:hypothetical protein